MTPSLLFLPPSPPSPASPPPPSSLPLAQQCGSLRRGGWSRTCT